MLLLQDEDEDGPSRRRKRSNFVDVEAAEDEAEEDDEEDEVGHCTMDPHASRCPQADTLFHLWLTLDPKL